jgi:hypothetical protein
LFLSESARDAVERAHDPIAVQQLGGRNAGAFLLPLGRAVAVTRRDRVARVDDHLARELRAQILAELWHSAIRHGDEHDGAERCGFFRRAGVCARPELLDEALELLGVARRHEHLVAGLHPMARERAADLAGADDADLQRRGRCLRGGRTRDPREETENGGLEHAAATNSIKHCTAHGFPRNDKS